MKIMFDFIFDLFRTDPKPYYVVASHNFDTEFMEYAKSLSLKPSKTILNTSLFYIDEETATLMKLKFQWIRVYTREEFEKN